MPAPRPAGAARRALPAPAGGQDPREQTPPAARWRALAARKLEEVNALMDRAGRMKLLLETSFQCRCPRLEDCEQFLRSAKRKQAVDHA